MRMRNVAVGSALGVVATMSFATVAAPPAAQADNRRLNDGVVANVATMHERADCPTKIKINPKLRLAAQWHTNDVLHNRALDGDIGSDGSTVADRARNAGYAGTVSETVAINPALAINGVEILNQWWYRPDYHAIMHDCANVDIGVWSANSLDRSVVVAVYGTGDGAAPVPAPPRQFGQRPPNHP
ncbi:CAP domain-containing protein [[Mycobacterium] wendilense]